MHTQMRGAKWRGSEMARAYSEVGRNSLVIFRIPAWAGGVAYSGGGRGGCKKGIWRR